MILMVKKCPRCGRSSDTIVFYGQFCKNCIEKDLSEVIPNTAEVQLCKNCGKLNLKGIFVNDNSANMQDILQGIFKNYEVNLIDYDREKELATICFSKQTNGGRADNNHR